MRPLQLTMVAFGPFAGKETIDFTALGRNPLFLLNGPTGAGKTTILDAICFALYGKTTGDEREGSQMRCDSADEADLTEVIFCFALAGQRYRIRRVPEQARQKKSGDGYTVQKPEAQLYQINADDSESLLVAAKVSQATETIEQLTGLDADQFRQVMVLPQGKFRQLLMADSKDREKIFSQLFQTQSYRKIEEKLKQQAAGISAQVKEQRHRRDGILLNAEVVSESALHDEIAGLLPELTAAEQAKTQANQAMLALSKQLENAQQLTADFTRLTALKQAALQLKEQQPTIAALEFQLNKAREAQQLKPVYDGLLKRQQELIASQTLFARAEQHQQDCKVQLQACEQAFNGLPEHEQTLQALQQQQQSLTQLAPQIAKASQLRQQLVQSQQTIEQALQQQQAYQQRYDAYRQQKQAAEQQLLPLQEQSEQRLPLQQAVNDQRQLIALYQQWVESQQQLSLSQQQLEKAKVRGVELNAEHVKARERWLQCQLFWHRGQAAVLASELAVGEPCPVCGSAEHPQPAHSEQAVPSEAQLQQAQHDEQQAQNVLTKAREDYALIKQQVADRTTQSQSLAEKLGADTSHSLDSLNQQLEALSVQYHQAQQAQATIEALRQQLQNWQLEETALLESIENAKQQCQQWQTTKASQQGELSSIEQQVPEQYRDQQRLDNALSTAGKQIAQLQQQLLSIRQQHSDSSQQLAAAISACESARGQQQTAAQHLQEQQDDFEQQLVIRFTSNESQDNELLDVFLAALITPAQQHELQQQIVDYQQQNQQTQANISQLTERLEGQQVPDVKQLERLLSASQQECQVQEQRWQQVQTRMTLLTQTQKQLQAADQQAAQLEKDYAVIGTLADVANGNTGNKISLQRFVLSVLLDDVLLEASHRLRLMSKGRYQLLRKEDRAKGNKASGLELEVEDAYTSKVRPVATLSGGESFMAALAMALGLSEVVQAYAGGIKLETLFIDEGFGSLDQESLDLAVRTLIDLQHSGRMVGVISHVAEMKEQITTRIDVKKSSMGSHCVLVV